MIMFHFVRLNWHVARDTSYSRYDTIVTEEMSAICESYGRFWLTSTAKREYQCNTRYSVEDTCYVSNRKIVFKIIIAA